MDSGFLHLEVELLLLFILTTFKLVVPLINGLLIILKILHLFYIINLLKYNK